MSERFCCDNLCEQGRDCPVRNQPIISKSEREWVGLTDEEIKERWIASYAALPRYACFASEIEAMLKEKNA